jgi:hypothetical protein
MTKSVKQATPVTPVTPPNTSKRAIARLKVREAKYGSTTPRTSAELLRMLRLRSGTNE